jgi:hypothetical protein
VLKINDWMRTGFPFSRRSAFDKGQCPQKQARFGCVADIATTASSATWRGDEIVDRKAASVEAWLADRPEVEIVSRDHGGGYGQTVVRAAPEGIPVADRWRLTENASGAFLDGVRRSMTPIRRALGAGAQMFGRAYVLEGSKNAYSLSDIRFRAKIASIPKAILNQILA